jgi:hypothetical protein
LLLIIIMLILLASWRKVFKFYTILNLFSFLIVFFILFYSFYFILS